MQIRVVTLRYNEALQGFPEDALKSVTFGREVLNVSEHFFMHGNMPHLTLVLSLGDSPQYENAASDRPRDPASPDPEEGMSDAQKTRYRALLQRIKGFDEVLAVPYGEDVTAHRGVAVDQWAGPERYRGCSRGHCSISLEKRPRCTNSVCPSRIPFLALFRER
ncbi:MAG: hypothetical protein J6Z49_10085 [Kiritimatiellae bacterium]|nr:hypothetical protein [Kiritimatiellia bacterium]